MSSTNKTTYYELPQFVDNDIFNPLVDDNDAYSKIDTALHNIANAEADDASEIIGIKSRLNSAEGAIDTIEAQNGDDVLTTTAQTLSGAVNELDSDTGSLNIRLNGVENDISNPTNGINVKINSLNTAISNEANTRASSDAQISSAITAETLARTNADATLANDISTETNARVNADTALSSAISNETNARISADATMQAQIDELIAPAGEAPNPAEIIDARIGENGITYTSLGEAIREQVGELTDGVNYDADYIRFFMNSMEVGTANINTDGTQIVYNNGAPYDTLVIRTKRNTTFHLDAGDVIVNRGRLRVIRKVDDNEYVYPTGYNDYITSDFVAPISGDYFIVVTSNPETSFSDMSEVVKLISICKNNSYFKQKIDTNSDNLYDVSMLVPSLINMLQGTAYEDNATHNMSYDSSSQLRCYYRGVLNCNTLIKWNSNYKVALYVVETRRENTDKVVYSTNGFLPNNISEYELPSIYKDHIVVVVIAKDNDSVITTVEANANITFTTKVADKLANVSPIYNMFNMNGVTSKLKDVSYNVDEDISYTHDSVQTNQSLAIFNDKMYQCTSNNKIVEYDIGTSAINRQLSINIGHANACQFSDEYYNGNTIPLLYVFDFYDPIVYAVNITDVGASVVKTYGFNDTAGGNNTLYKFSGAYDKVNKKLITISTFLDDAFTRTGNYMIVKIWDMITATYDSGINYKLSRVKEYNIPFIFCMQDCKFYNGTMYIVSSSDSSFIPQYGEGETKIYCLDVYNENITGIFEDFPTAISNAEVEGIDAYDDYLIGSPLSGASFTVKW